MVKSNKRIIIIGKGEGWKDCPTNTDREIWGLNSLVFQTKKPLDRIFMMDVLDEMPLVISGKVKKEHLIKRINDHDVPLVAPYRYKEIPKSEAYPVEEVMKRWKTTYFTNTVAFMIAYALLKGVESIHFYGVNQAATSEYYHEKGSVEFWLGVAIGMGVDVKVHGEHSELLSCKARYGGNLLYGYNLTFDEIVANKQLMKQILPE